MNEEYSETVKPWSFLDKDFISSDFMRQESNIQDFDFFNIDKKTKEIHILPGTWNVNRDVIIPGDYIVKCFEGTRINLENSAKNVEFHTQKNKRGF